MLLPGFFVVLMHLVVNRPVDKAVHALALALCVCFDDVQAPFLHGKSEAVIFVLHVFCDGLLLRF